MLDELKFYQQKGSCLMLKITFGMNHSYFVKVNIISFDSAFRKMKRLKFSMFVMLHRLRANIAVCVQTLNLSKMDIIVYTLTWMHRLNV